MDLIAKAWIVALAATAAAPAGAQQTVSFATSDGGVVSAHVYGSGPHGVVLAHGAVFDKESWTAQAGVLADAGFSVVAIDFRGRGESGGGSDTSRGALYRDVLAAVDFLRGQGATTVSVVGGSMGGGAAAEAAVEAGPGVIDRLVLLASSPIDEPERLPGRKLFIIARDDGRDAGVPRLPGFRQQFERAPEPKELVVLDGSAHAQHIFATDGGARLMAEILRFLSAR